MYSFKLQGFHELITGKISFTSIFPDANIPSDCLPEKDIVFRVPHTATSKIIAGDVLVEFLIYRPNADYHGSNREVVSRYLIRSECDGYIYYEFSYDCKRFNHTYSLQALANPILVYPSLEDLIEDNFSIKYSIKKDDFSSMQYICWSGLGDKGIKRVLTRSEYWKNEYSEYLVREDSRYLIANAHYISIELTIHNNLPTFVLHYDSSGIKIQKGDTLSFKFEDNSIVHFPVLSQPKRYEKPICSVNIPLTSQDIERFSNVGWEKLKIMSYDGINNQILINIRPAHYEPKNSGEEFSRALFKVFSRQYSRALSEMGFTFDIIRPLWPETASTMMNRQAEPCYVYLMVDISNGFHKIGISSHPEYRERTLQSEKPTIEKICAKQYPSRVIAQSIEGALHTAFASKRIRGEWFNLTDEDVSQIIQTLM